MSVTAYVENQGPEGDRYWNPIKGTEADTVEACQARLDVWVADRAAQLSAQYPDAATFRACRRFEFHTTPAHAVGRFV